MSALRVPFVILWHEIAEPASNAQFLRQSHWDLMIALESPAANADPGLRLLATWELLQLPTNHPQQTVRRLQDHRLAYLDYEGPLSNGRGQVTRWDCGMANVVVQDGVDGCRWEVDLQGKALQGSLTIWQPADAEPVDLWELDFVPLEFCSG